ncbi:MAG: branched-chain amino acid ABC transporter permease [Bradymonadaceae bacterium]
MSSFLQLTFSGLALGAVYALVALGFVVIYRSSEVLNFAQGELLTFGAFAMVMATDAGLPWPVALVVAMTATGLLGAAIERIFLRPLIGRPVFVTIILTIFIGFLLRTAYIVGFGTEPVRMSTPWETTADIHVGGASILYNSLGTIAAGGLVLAAFYAIMKHTKLGVAMRATASDQEVALSLGIPVGRIFGTAWFFAGALAAVGGIFLGMYPRSVDAHLGLVALRAFPAVIVGGLDSALGATLAGLGLGILEVWTQGYVNEHLGTFGENFHTVLPYLVMIVFLVIKPYGLFGSKEVERV